MPKLQTPPPQTKGYEQMSMNITIRITGDSSVLVDYDGTRIEDNTLMPGEPPQFYVKRAMSIVHAEYLSSKGSTLKAQRVKLGLTLKEVAIASGYSISHIHAIENGKKNCPDATLDILETYEKLREKST
jgi:hypothetical protein